MSMPATRTYVFSLPQPAPPRPRRRRGEHQRAQRLVWAEKVLAAFPEMSIRDAQDALIEKFGAGVDPREIQALRRSMGIARPPGRPPKERP